MKIALFGGAFDPPTKAHRMIIDNILERKICDHIFVVPSLNHRFGKSMTEYDTRIEMCKSVFHKAGCEVTVSNVESKYNTEGKIYSLASLFKSTYPDDEIYIVIGGDNARDIHKFYNGEKLIQENKFIIVERIYETAEPLKRFEEYDWDKESDIRMYLDDYSVCISSSAVREKIKELREMIDERTLNQIIKKDLYK